MPAPAVEAETQRVVREYGRRVRLPGFREGKVPAELVRRRFAKDIEQEVIERLLPRYWRQAQAETSIDPLLPPEVDEVADLQPGEPLTFVATVEIRPQIELRNIQDFDLPDPRSSPGRWRSTRRSTICNASSRTGCRSSGRRRAATWWPARSPRWAPPSSRRSAPRTSRSRSATPRSGRSSRSPSGPGRRPGDDVHPASRGSAGGGGGEPEAREQRFRVKAVAVKERDLPPLDDAFAAKVNPEFETVDELREAIVRRLRANKGEQRREQRQRALLDQLRERHPLELPQGVVRQEVEHLVQDYAESLARRGVDVERPASTGTGSRRAGAARRAAGARPPAARRDRRAQRIAVTEEEFERTLAVIARAQGVSTPVLRRKLDEDGRLATLRSQLRREKTIRHLLGEPADEAAPAVRPEPTTEA